MKIALKILIGLLFLAPTSALAYSIPYSTVGSTSLNVLFQSAAAANGANTFIGINGNVAQPNTTTPTAARMMPLPCQGLASNFGIKVATAPGVGNSWTVTLRQVPFGSGNTNNATGITCTIADNATSCTDPVNTFLFIPGDAPVVKLVTATNPASTTYAGGFVYYPYDPNCTIMGAGGAALSAGGLFKTGGVVTANWSSNPVGAPLTRLRTVLPFNATLKNLYTKTQTTQGAPNGTTFAIVNEGTGATTTLIAYQLSGVPTATDLTDTASFSDGDSLTGVATTTAVNTNASGAWGVGIYPQITGDFTLAGSENASGGADSATLNMYVYVIGAQATTTLADAQAFIPGDMLYKKVEVLITTAPGVGKTRNFYTMINGATTTQMCSITGATQTSCVMQQPLGITAGDLINYVDEPINAPAVTASIKISPEATRYFTAPQFAYVGGQHLVKGGRLTHQVIPFKTATIQAWGGSGGAGAAGSGGDGGTGGGGGAYSQSTIPVVNAISYTVTVGAAGVGGIVSTSNGTVGGDTSFNGSGNCAAQTVCAKGGAGGGNGNGSGDALGGAAASGIGTIKQSGGLGKAGPGGANKGGSGGGGSGGNTSDGGPGIVGGATAGGAGGTAGTTNGTAGTIGGNQTVTGGPGVQPGGGGGAGGGAGGQGGAGAKGQVVIKAPLGTITSATGGTHTSDPANDIWTFTSSGTWVPTIP